MWVIIMFWRKKSNEDNINLVEEVSNLKEVVKKQSILIEDLVEENKGLLENYEEVEFNISKLTNKVENNISKLINVAEYNFQEVKDQLNLQNDIDGIPKNDEPKIYREYSETAVRLIPKLTLIDNNGKLISGNGKICKYDMDTLIGLKKDIPNLDLNSNKLAKKYNLSVSTIDYLCAGIELGKFDKLYDEYKSDSTKYELPSSTSYFDNIKEYTPNGLDFDGFYYSPSRGTQVGNNIFNILDVIYISENLNEFIINLEDYNWYILNEFPLRNLTMKKIIKTLKDTDVFTSDLNDYNSCPAFKLTDDGLLYINGQFSGLRDKDVHYIKNSVLNCADFNNTVEGLVNYYNEVSNKNIVNCAIYAEYLPEKRNIPTPIVNDPEKRKELGMGGY